MLEQERLKAILAIKKRRNNKLWLLKFLQYLKGVRISPQKARLVVDSIRGKKVDKALDILTFSPKKGAEIVKKVVESAIANAENNNGADIDELAIKTIYVDKGTVLKRQRAGAKGRGKRIIKPTSHITVTVGN